MMITMHISTLALILIIEAIAILIILAEILSRMETRS